MNPINTISLLHLQNKTYDPKILEQAQVLFEKISRAILADLNFIDFDEPIYAVNVFLLQSKGYIYNNGKIVWNDFKLEM